jgi:hypothetical protein
MADLVRRLPTGNTTSVSESTPSREGGGEVASIPTKGEA